MQAIRNLFLGVVTVTMASLVVIQFSGCGQGAGEVGNAPTDKDQRAMYDLVVSMADFARNDETFAEIFVEGKAPKAKERQKYNSTWSFYPQQDTAKVEGNSGTMEVEVRDRDDFSDAPGTMMTWQFSKEGEDWKIEDAPLP